MSNEFNQKRLHTPDLNAERLATLKQLLPDLFTSEGTLNPDELNQMINPTGGTQSERFEFNWFGKSNAKRNAFTPSNATLLYDQVRSIHPEHAAGNMIIEGENLETLKCLLAGYREKIKCIYIDPPYNTGKDFVYSDNWDQSKQDYWQQLGVLSNDGVRLETNPEASGRFHSNWLNMIYPRLLLARQLLRNDGVIFISIDDNEAHHLRKVCDEVFGTDNFVANLIWNNSTGGGLRKKHFNQNTEYIICFCKDKSILEQFYAPMSLLGKEQYKKEDRFGNKYREQQFAWQNTSDGVNQKYPITTPDGTRIIPRKGYIYRFIEETFYKKLKNNLIIFKQTENSCFETIKGHKTKWSISVKDYLGEGITAPVTLLPKEYVKMNIESVSELRGIFCNKIMEYTKPSTLLKYLSRIVLIKNDIILDFFAGSGTTAHAVTELNQEDGGNRKYILVQIPEAIDRNSEAYHAGYKKISDITIERNKRVIANSATATAKQPALIGFKVYRLAKSNFPRVEFTSNPDITEDQNLELLQHYIAEKEQFLLSKIDLDLIIDEVLLKNGFMLHYIKQKATGFTKNTVYYIHDSFKTCYLCLDQTLYPEIVNDLEPHKNTVFICLEQALDTTTKWNLKHSLGDKLIAF